MKIKLSKITLTLLVVSACIGYTTYASTKIPSSFDTFEARPPIHTSGGGQITATPRGLTPTNIKNAYHLPVKGGTGTIAIITVYRHPALESDLAMFDKQFSLTPCTVADGCLEEHAFGSSTKTDTGWSLESALDTEWAHAIAPTAKILLIEASSTKGADLLKAVDYARNRSDVVAVSMSWGGDEFSDEARLDKHFDNNPTKSHTVRFFASSGDDGTGVSWPAVSPDVIAVGGTSLVMDKSGHFVYEKAWSGSGGGLSAYESQPSYQISYDIPHSNNKRAIPDVAYAADPINGFSVYHVESITGKSSASIAKGWYVVGGTSAGAPQWAAIQALGNSVSLAELYKDKAGPIYATYFRDIVSGKNGTCAYYCNTRARYDYVTGLGTPITDKF